MTFGVVGEYFGYSYWVYMSATEKVAGTQFDKK